MPNFNLWGVDFTTDKVTAQDIAKDPALQVSIARAFSALEAEQTVVGICQIKGAEITALPHDPAQLTKDAPVPRKSAGPPTPVVLPSDPQPVVSPTDAGAADAGSPSAKATRKG